MINQQTNSCPFERSAEILMYMTSTFISCSVFFPFLLSIIARFKIINIPRNFQSLSLILSSAYVLLLPLMSYLFSQAKQYNLEVRAQVILIWMVLIEIIRVRSSNFSTWKLLKLAEQFARLLWVGFLANSYTHLPGFRVGLFILCSYAAISEVMKGIMFMKSQDSFLLGRNPKLIQDYLKKKIIQNNLQTTPMRSCDYIVMGEEHHEIAACSKGYLLGNQKANSSEGMLTIGRVFELNSSEDEVFTMANPDWRDTCLSFALAKMLRSRFAKLPVDEAGCRKALDFVLEGLIDYIGSNQDIQTDVNSREIRYPMNRVFSIIQKELNFVSDFLDRKVPIYHYFNGFVIFDWICYIIMVSNVVYLLSIFFKKGSAWHSHAAHEEYKHCISYFSRGGSVKVETFYELDLGITFLLILACLSIPSIGSTTAFQYKLWSNLGLVKKYIKDPAKYNRSYNLFEACKSRKLLSVCANWIRDNFLPIVRAFPSILDVEAVLLYPPFCLYEILACLPKWIRRKIPAIPPTFVLSSDAKEAILYSLRNSGGRLTNGETSLRNHQMENLINRDCQPNGSTTEAILTWHIATTLFHHQQRSLQQNTVPRQEPPPQQNNNPYKEQEVALGLSNYCHYLVKYLPELLPDEVDWTEGMYGRVEKEILDIDRSSQQVPCKNYRCNYALQAIWEESSVLGKGARLAKELVNCAQEGIEVWKMMAEFWAELMLFISPSDNVDGHKNNLDRAELITQLWALLTHAGIVTRPKPTEHQDHHSESRDGAQMRTMVGVGRLLMAQFDNVEGSEEIEEIGNELEVRQSERIPVTGDQLA